jgi:hypothetical protein
LAEADRVFYVNGRRSTTKKRVYWEKCSLQILMRNK